MTIWPAIIPTAGTVVGAIAGAALVERSKRTERKHLRHVQFDAQLLDAATRLSREATSLHDRLRYRLPLAGIVPTLKSVAQSLDASAFTEAATFVRLICPASRTALQGVQVTLLGLVNLCSRDTPPPDNELASASTAVIAALQQLEEVVRKQLGIEGDAGKMTKGPGRLPGRGHPPAHSMKSNGYTLRLALHATALVFEVFGTLFVLLDSIRINERASEVGYVDAGSEPAWLDHWYYHSALLGFALLFAGILFVAAVLWFEHWEHVRSMRTIQADGESGS